MAAQVLTGPTRFLPIKPPIECPDCDGGLMHLQHKPASWSGPNPFVYRCATRGCAGLLSAHPDGSPVGVAVTKEVRQARRHCHSVFDPLWLEAYKVYEIREEGKDRAKAFAIIKRTARKRSYEFLADQLSMTVEACHIGKIADIEVLRNFYRIAKATSAADIRAWAKAKKAAT